jgi:hypothetical protein
VLFPGATTPHKALESEFEEEDEKMTARAPEDSTCTFDSEDLQEILWNRDTGAATARSVPSVLVVRLAGPCTYPQFVKLSYYLARRWEPLKQRLLLDLSDMRSAEKEGVRFLIEHLRSATTRGGQVYFIRPQILSRRERNSLSSDDKFRVAGGLDQCFLPESPRPAPKIRRKPEHSEHTDCNSFLTLPEIEFLGLGVRA